MNKKLTKNRKERTRLWKLHQKTWHKIVEASKNNDKKLFRALKLKLAHIERNENKLLKEETKLIRQFGLD